jgi:hypothetical protein
MSFRDLVVEVHCVLANEMADLRPDLTPTQVYEATRETADETALFMIFGNIRLADWRAGRESMS